MGNVHAQVGLLTFAWYPDGVDELHGTWEPGHDVVVLAAGYFGYDVLNCVVRKYDWAFTMHGIVCFACYTLATTPFLERDVLYYLSWEMTTVVFNLIRAERGDTPGKEVYKRIFFVLFFVVRICCGYGYTAGFVCRMWPRLRLGEWMLPLFMGMVSVANGLNTFWFAKLVQRALVIHLDS